MFLYISNKGAATIKSFWNRVKPFITQKGIQTNENITNEVEKKMNKQRSKAYMKELISKLKI